MAEPKKEVAAAKEKSGVYVAKGRSVTTQRGIKGPGELIPEGLIPSDDVKRLIDKKVLVKK